MIKWFKRNFSALALARFVGGIFRRIHPVLKFRGDYYVFAYDEVCRVLSSSEFSVVENYAARMAATTGPFFLGMDLGPEYDRERQFAQAAVLPQIDFPKLSTWGAAWAKELLQVAKRNGDSFDFVEGFSRQIPMRLLSEYFGVSSAEAGRLADHLRQIFWYLFLDFTNDTALKARALAASAELSTLLDGIIAKEEAVLSSKESNGSLELAELNFVQRLIQIKKQEYSDLNASAVRRNLGGIIVGAVDTISKSMVYVLQELDIRPVQLLAMQRAADADRIGEVRGIASECLRYRPHNPLIVRHSLAGASIHQSKGKQVPISAGTRVFAMTLSASFDSEHFAEPSSFRSDRPMQDYLSFGYSTHRCFGEKLVLGILPAAMAEFYRTVEVKKLFEVKEEGPFPANLPITVRFK